MQHALFAILLPTLFAATPTRAPAPSASPRMLEIEIVEKPAGGKTTRTRLELPANAKLDARVTNDGTSGRSCTVDAQHDKDRGSSIELRCRQPGGPDSLAIEARPDLVVGKRITLAKIDRPDGGTVEVTAVAR
ncbi:MAG TPA: hypothetical protein VG755_08435 [Nannocystaceae bacterium]|nr:hypothetical protein [Nannocystaceae bacterium]